MRVTRLFSRLCITVLLCSSLRASEGVASFERGEYSQALEQLAPAAHNGDETARVYLALTQAALGRCGEAMPVLTRESNSSNVSFARLTGIATARCYAAEGKLPEAITTAENLKKRFPSNADVLYVAAETEMKAFNDTTFAMFQRTPSSYRVHELSARIFEVQDRFADAVVEYGKAIELQPSAPDLHYRLGRAILLESHSPESLQHAADAFRAELKISPEDSASEYQLGQIAMAQAQTTDARQHFERALQLSPDFVSAMVALAGLYSHENQNPRAIALLARAAALQPDNEAVHYALLTAYRNAGDMDKARSEKETLDRLRKPPEGEFTDFLKKLGDSKPQQ